MNHKKIVNNYLEGSTAPNLMFIKSRLFLRIILGISLLILLKSFGHSQSRDYNTILSELDNAQGKGRYHLLIELCNQDINNDQDLTYKRAKEAKGIAERIGFTQGIGWGLRYMG